MPVPERSSVEQRYFIVGARQRVESWCRENGRSLRESNVIHVNTKIKAYGYRLTEQDEIVDVAEWEDYPIVVALHQRRRNAS